MEGGNGKVSGVVASEVEGCEGETSGVLCGEVGSKDREGKAVVQTARARNYIDGDSGLGGNGNMADL